MFGLFKKKSAPPEKPEASIAHQPPGEVFPWTKGVRLVAVDDVTFAIPAAVLSEDEQIGSVVLGDADIDIGLPKVSHSTPGAMIYLRLRAGMSVWLSRSCQAMVVADDKTPRRIKVIRQ